MIRGWDFGGDGPIALLHHANGMCAATWAPVAVGLQSNFRVVAIDARGHGDSEHLSVPQDYDWRFLVSDLYGVAEQLLDESGQSVISLGIGSSFGGIITAGTEAARPGLFERLMLLDPPIHPTQDLIDALGLEQEAQPPSRRDQLVTQTLRRRVQWPSREAARRAWRTNRCSLAGSMTRLISISTRAWRTCPTAVCNSSVRLKWRRISSVPPAVSDLSNTRRAFISPCVWSARPAVFSG